VRVRPGVDGNSHISTTSAAFRSAYVVHGRVMRSVVVTLGVRALLTGSRDS
jgi:hypothetical protein